MTLARASRLLINAACVLVIVLGAAWLLPGVLGYERYVITGGSMADTFDTGAIAFEKVVPVDELRVGDVITYQPPADAGITSLVTHRITAIGESPEGQRVFRTRGDANPAVDPWEFSLTESRQPVVAFTVPGAGYVLMALADRTVRMALVGGPAALIALLALAELAGNLRSREDRGTDASDLLADRRPVPVALPG